MTIKAFACQIDHSEEVPMGDHPQDACRVSDAYVTLMERRRRSGGRVLLPVEEVPR